MVKHYSTKIPARKPLNGAFYDKIWHVLGVFSFISYNKFLAELGVLEEL